MVTYLAGVRCCFAARYAVVLSVCQSVPNNGPIYFKLRPGCSSSGAVMPVVLRTADFFDCYLFETVLNA